MKASILKEKSSNSELSHSLQIDLFDCHPDLISSEVHIREFIDQLLDILKSNPYGGCIVVHHGKDEKDLGYTAFQITESFSVSLHCIDAKQCACIHIFSDKDLNVDQIVAFSKNFFEANSEKIHKMMRP